MDWMNLYIKNRLSIGPKILRHSISVLVRKKVGQNVIIIFKYSSLSVRIPIFVHWQVHNLNNKTPGCKTIFRRNSTVNSKVQCMWSHLLSSDPGLLGFLFPIVRVCSERNCRQLGSRWSNWSFQVNGRKEMTHICNSCSYRFPRRRRRRSSGPFILQSNCS